MVVRIRFVGGCLAGTEDDMAPDEVLQNTPMYIGGWNYSQNVPLTQVYELNPTPDADSIYTFDCTNDGTGA